jgi:formyltetrahydrofolate-dependent phosphoribosylglycinamide formyltransferase
MSVAPAPKAGRRLRLACLISGAGRTMLNLADCIDDGSLNATIELVIASRSSIAGVEKARERGFDTHTILRRDFDSDAEMHDRISYLLRDRQIDLACLCGYLRWFRVDPDLAGRVINIHPALLPEFGGQGMHGERVHAAVLNARKTVSGCTVHYVDDRYDHGATILQRTCPVLADDTPQTLAARVFEQECIAYPEAIRLMAGRGVAQPR